MEVVSLGPLPVASLLWQPRPDAWMFTFVCKATYSLRPGESPPAPEQLPLNKSDRHWGDDPSRSLMAPSDIAPIRPKADVVLVGNAFAPGGIAVRSLVTRLVVADIDKSIEVHCDRFLGQDGSRHDGPQFTQMSLGYERAAGGPDSANPVGIRPDARDVHGNRKVPNLQVPSTRSASSSDRGDLIGFGPIAPSWPSRRDRLGRYAGTFSSGDWVKQPLPQDLDASYFNAAPRDQQTQVLRENERITLEHLHPDHPHLTTNLPGMRPHAFVRREGKAPQSVPMRPDLLWIHTDRAICTLTWRGQVSLEHGRDEGVVLVALESPGQVLTWEDMERLMSRGAPTSMGAGARFGGVGETLPPPITGASGPEQHPLGGTLTVPLSAPSSGTVLPFGAKTSGAPAATQANPSEPAVRGAGTPFATSAEQPRRRDSSPEWMISPPPPPAPVSSSVPSAATPAPAIVVQPAIHAPSFNAPSPPAGSPWASGSPPPIGIAKPASAAALASPPPSAPALREGPDMGGSAAGASNAAAAASAAWLVPRIEPSPDLAPERAASPAPQPAARPETREVFDLVWYDPESVPRIRRQSSWRRILSELEKMPLDKDLDDPALAREPMDIEDRREVFEILARGEATDVEGVQAALARAVREDGKYVPPLLLIAGELVFPFDELEKLKATVTTVTPLVGTDEQLRSTVAVAQEFLKLPELRSAPAVAEGLTTRIKDAFAQGKRTVQPGYLDAQTERVLLEQRCYQRRAVFKAPHLRALLQPAGSSQTVPTYLPDSLAQELPMYQRFKARVIAEVRLQVDQYESHQAALRVLALVRVAPPPSKR